MRGEEFCTGSVLAERESTSSDCPLRALNGNGRGRLGAEKLLESGSDGMASHSRDLPPPALRCTGTTGDRS